jgi:hypothetical protein
MNWLLFNLLLTIPFVALWIGVPVWLVLKHTDTGPDPAATPAM